uniref:Cation/H+ exchanger domain-containing protein n=1 Tax=Globisporangium ultimum (strain ATCC 200006 / CBS 805.95 / DAOM BR144) TaxID=431595 RepID=K3WWY0_GLOUD
MTFPLCYVANLWRSHAIPFKYMFVIWYSGLRGAVAFALSLNVKSVSGSNHAAIIRSATIFTVLTTTIVSGHLGIN